MFPKAYYQENENLVHHLKIKKGDVGKYVIITGDPKRCIKIADKFDNAELIADYREYITYTGYINETKISAVSHGIGGPSAAIALEELIKAGADTFIRIGTCGTSNINVHAGDIIIVNGAVKIGGTMDNYIPKEFPCVPNIDILEAMIEESEKTKLKTHIGIVQCKDALYSDKELLYKDNILASEMESASIFAVGASKNVRTGSALFVMHNHKISENNNQNCTIEEAIDFTIETIKILINNDKNRSK